MARSEGTQKIIQTLGELSLVFGAYWIAGPEGFAILALVFFGSFLQDMILRPSDNPESETPLQELLEDMQSEMDVDETPNLFVTDEGIGGTLNPVGGPPVFFISKQTQEADSITQRSILAHEMAHLSRNAFEKFLIIKLVRTAILISLTLVPKSPIVLFGGVLISWTLLVLFEQWLHRYEEYKADQIAAEYITPGELQRTLYRTYDSEDRRRKIQDLFSAHPPTKKRIEKLKGKI